MGFDGYETVLPKQSLAMPVCGPLGLLQLLETRLGLKAKTVSSAHRVVEFRQILEQISIERPAFYNESFKKDPYAVAETLLPVSYTHLDVYKRQIQRFFAAKGCRKNCATKRPSGKSGIFPSRIWSSTCIAMARASSNFSCICRRTNNESDSSCLLYTSRCV